MGKKVCIDNVLLDFTTCCTFIYKVLKRGWKGPGHNQYHEYVFMNINLVFNEKNDHRFMLKNFRLELIFLSTTRTISALLLLLVWLKCGQS